MSINATLQIRPQLTSSAIRRAFIDYFCVNNGHQFVRSSPVLPFNDATLAFTNAGMNQFKAVLQGLAPPLYPRVANSQKCVRVGGKHNDLALVGQDGTHHTFFEMLGNWSFGDYFKKESCKMSWDLLTGVYGLDKSKLHVTYFAGEPSLGLEADLETKEIWREIGVPEDHLKPGGVRDNFWEMGESGPCGACTEIHYDSGIEGPNRLLEVWNLVFVQYNRELNGDLSKLGRHHVDTGMGLERLVAILQSKNSNYDTDLFRPLFDCIHRLSNCPPYSGQFGSYDHHGLDTAYRILADHTRMMTVCLADGFFPDTEGKLRGIIRKALTVSWDSFKKDSSLLRDLSSVVCETLSDGYPEIGRNLNRVHHFIDHEAEVLRVLRLDTLKEWEELRSAEPSLSCLSVQECPSLLSGYRRLRSILGGDTKGKALSPPLAWKMCETFGIPPHLIEQLATALEMTLDVDALEMEVTQARLQSKKEIYGDELRSGSLSSTVVEQLHKRCVPPTRDIHKYQYYFGFEDALSFPHQSASISALVVDGNLVDDIPETVLTGGSDIGIIFDRTNMYSEEGGQAADSGIILVENSVAFTVRDVINTGGYVVHWVKCIEPKKEVIRVGNNSVIQINAFKRISTMRNHTATHLLNAGIRKYLKVTEQKSSRVTADKLSFDFSVYRESLGSRDLEAIQRLIRGAIIQDVPVRRRSIPSHDVNTIDPLTVVPGETYLQRDVYLIEVSSDFLFSREPCCGTHVRRTSEVEEFVLTNFKSLSSGVKTISAVTGENAMTANANTSTFKIRILQLEKDVNAVLQQQNERQVESCDATVTKFLKELKDTELVSFVDKMRMIEKADELRAKLKLNARGTLRSLMDTEMREALEHNTKKVFVHYLKCSSSLDDVPLQKASKLCGKTPSLIIATSNGVVKARCCVPQSLVSDKFSAQLWLGHVCEIVGAQGGPPKGQDPKLVYNMKGKKLEEDELKKMIDAANSFAKDFLG